MSSRAAREALQGFVDLWKEFHGCFRRALEEEVTSAEDEERFLKVKSRIAQEYEGILRIAGERVRTEDRTIPLITEAPTLRSFKEMSEAQRRKFEAEWHRTFIYLQTVIGRLRGEKDAGGLGGWFVRGTQVVFRILLVAILIAVLTWALMILIQSPWIGP